MSKSVEELEELRAKAISEEEEWYYYTYYSADDADGVDAKFDPKSIKYTCDNCSLKFVCEHVFDSYNKNGDCLASK